VDLVGGDRGFIFVFVFVGAFIGLASGSCGVFVGFGLEFLDGFLVFLHLFADLFVYASLVFNGKFLF